GCTRCGQSQSRADGANSALDVPAAVEPSRLVAGDERDLLVDVPLLRLWGSLGDQSDNYRCVGVRRDFGGKRDGPSPRPTPALSRPVQGSASGDPTDARGDRQIAPEPQ